MRACRWLFLVVVVLCLAGQRNLLPAGGEPARTRATEDWPTWHITALPEEGHCVPYDANGGIFWKGKYHLMYIFQSHGGRRGHCWGHASSTDLVNWTFHPASLALEPGEPDAGTFSGNAFVNKEGKPMLCWFGIDAGVCVATAEDDDLIRWKKHPKNPIIADSEARPTGLRRLQGVGSVPVAGRRYLLLPRRQHLLQRQDTLYLLKSPDLVHWIPLHAFYDIPIFGFEAGSRIAPVPISSSLATSTC